MGNQRFGYHPKLVTPDGATLEHDVGGAVDRFSGKDQKSQPVPPLSKEDNNAA
jgi:hypothetical protein